jgi:hypothetical protein
MKNRMNAQIDDWLGYKIEEQNYKTFEKIIKSEECEKKSFKKDLRCWFEKKYENDPQKNDKENDDNDDYTWKPFICVYPVSSI